MGHKNVLKEAYEKPLQEGTSIRPNGWPNWSMDNGQEAAIVQNEVLPKS